MSRGIFVAFTKCADPSREEEFNRWYTHTHLPDLSATKGFVSARRFVSRSPEGEATYLAMYEFEGDLDASVEDLTNRARAAFPLGRHIDCLAIAPISGLGAFEEIDPASLKPLEVLDYPREPRARA